MRLASTVLAFLIPAAVYAQPGAQMPPLVPCGTPASDGAEVLCGARSPEDAEVTPDGKALVVPQMVRNQKAGLQLFDIAAKKYTPLPVTNDPLKDWGDAACPGPIGDQLSGHGTSLVKRADGKWALLVVNHGGRESIEMFELKNAANGWAAYWHGCVVSPKDFNDVAALPDGSFVATHPTALEPPAQPGGGGGGGNLFDGHPSGYIVRWQAGKGETELPGTRVGYANGVVASKDGRYLYIAAWTAKEIHKYDVRASKDVTVTKLDFMPDNITWTQKGQLLTAGVKGTRGNCPATSTTPCILGFNVAQIDPATMKIGQTFDSRDRALIAGVSVALQVGPAIYVGAFQGDRLVKIDWKQ